MVTTLRNPNPDPAAHLRHVWARQLNKRLDALTLSRKKFRAMLQANGLEVSQQTIGHWLTGKHAPKPLHQAVIAKTLMAEVPDLFPIEAAA